MDGIFNVNKPEGKTSYKIVSMIKRLSGERRVGHAGTLDPAATGVLPVCVGKATRVVQYLANAAKAYRAGIFLGTSTDTYDASGQVTHQGDSSGIDRHGLEAALDSFRGSIRQIPPMYSALKHHGQPLYTLARAGIDIERESRPVTIYRLEITDWQPPLVTVEVECSKGTYIRSLAHDLGHVLGCGAHLKSLVRTSYGPFDISNSVTIPQMEEAFSCGDWKNLLYPLDYVLHDLSAVVVNQENEDAIKNGSLLNSGQFEEHDASLLSGKEYCRAYSKDGRFLGILRYVPDAGCWHPEKVFIQS